MKTNDLDLAVDPPARIAVIGAGPIGLESALYARFLGYSVCVLEKGRVADHVRRWGHVRMFSPFAMNHSPLGLAALEAQNTHYRPPSPDAYLTGDQWADAYLMPLAESDLLADCIREQAHVTDIARFGCTKGAYWNDPASRAEFPFLIRYEDRSGEEQTVEADVVIDASGVYHCPKWIGPGGMPAAGERLCRSRITYHLPDVEGTEREAFAGQRVLVVGSGYSAATTVVSLAKLAEQAPGTAVVWLTRLRPGQQEPIPRFAPDPLPERDGLAEAANRIARGHPAVEHLPGWWIETVAWNDNHFLVTLKEPSDQESSHDTAARKEVRAFDRIVANVGYRPDTGLFRELHVHQCYATEGPIRLAARLLGENTTDCLAVGAAGGEALVTTEPHFYIVGSKSYGRLSHFLYQNGLKQIRDIFAIIGGRAGLDLYKTVQPAKKSTTVL
ncbi:MAG: FAD-dependent oxidoreductase [Pirellulaceae bacterium]|nr:MAG: FAD-dependent oxidoreductase [Pirellulaceae bacterium]